MHSRWIQSGFEVDPGWIRGDFEAPRRTAWAIRAPGAPPGARPGPNLESPRGVPRESRGVTGSPTMEPPRTTWSLWAAGARRGRRRAPKGCSQHPPASHGTSHGRSARALFAPGARRGRRGAPKGCNQHPPASHETSPGRSAWALFAPGARRFEANSS